MDPWSIVIRTLPAGYGLYSVVRGVLAWIDVGRSERMDSSKADPLIGKTVGVVVAGIGASIVLSTLRGASGSGSTASTKLSPALKEVDTVYSVKESQEPTGKLDLILQAVLIVGWMIALLSGGGESKTSFSANRSYQTAEAA